MLLVVIAAVTCGALGFKANSRVEEIPNAVDLDQATDQAQFVDRVKRGNAKVLESIDESIYSVNGRFTKEAYIHAGDFGMVVRVKEGNNEYAMKVADATSFRQPLDKEVEFMRKFKDFPEFPKIVYPDPAKNQLVGTATDAKSGKSYHFFAQTLTGPDFLTLAFRHSKSGKPYMTARQVVRFTLAVEAAIRKLHDQGYVHGDMSYSNYAINPDDTTKVMLIDFGKSGAAPATFQSLMGGTPAYDYTMLRDSMAFVIQSFYRDDEHLKKTFGGDKATFAKTFKQKLDEFKLKFPKQYTLQTFRTEFADKFVAFLKGLFENIQNEVGPLTSWSKGENVKAASKAEAEEFAQKHR